MAIGHEHSLLLSNVALPEFDYVALGHIHKQQILSEKPPVVYSGSLERVDFGEEKDEKGFYVIDIDPDPVSGTRKVTFEFHPVNTRRFLTINVAIEPDNPDPTGAILDSMAVHETDVRDAVVRLNINLPSHMEKQLQSYEIREALKEAHYFTIALDINRETRLRMGNRTSEELTPLDALKAYLETQNVSPERRKILLEYGKALIEGLEQQ